MTYSNTTSLLVHVQDLLLGSSVERVHLLADRGSDQLGIVVVKGRADTAVLVDLFGLGGEDGRLLANLGGDGLILAQGALAYTLVERVEKGQEARRDALFVYISRAQRIDLRSKSMARSTTLSPRT